MSDSINIEIEAIENSIESIKDKTREVIEKPKLEIDIMDEIEVSNKMLEMIENDRDKADKIFDLFYKDLELQKDRTTSSKEGLARALELKIEASKNLLELIKAKQKSKEVRNGVGIILNTISDKKMGINISGLTGEDD